MQNCRTIGGLFRIDGMLLEDIIKNNTDVFNGMISRDTDFTVFLPNGKHAYTKLNPLISSPHSAEHKRGDVVKIGEFRASTMAYDIHERYNVPAIIRTKYADNDPNWDEVSSYRDCIAEMIREKGINLVLDIHISSPTREYSIEVGTGKLRNIGLNAYMRDVVRNVLNTFYTNVTVDTVFPACGKHTVAGSTFLQHNVPALQLEVNWNEINTEAKIVKFTEVIGVLLYELDSLENIHRR